MIPLPQVDGLHAALSCFVTLGFVLWGNARSAVTRAEAKLAKAEKLLKEMRERPETAEFRIERFELLWFPVVTASVQTMEITNVVVGVPHCGKCAVPLGLEKGEWVCARCGARHPETLADTMVLDTVAQQAIKYFQERRPGYRVVVKGLKPSA
jgi:hypothetical protein